MTTQNNRPADLPEDATGSLTIHVTDYPDSQEVSMEGYQMSVEDLFNASAAVLHAVLQDAVETMPDDWSVEDKLATVSSLAGQVADAAMSRLEHSLNVTVVSVPDDVRQLIDGEDATDE